MSKQKTRRQRKNQQGYKHPPSQIIPALSRIRARDSIPTDHSYVVKDLKRIAFLGLAIFVCLGILSLLVN